MFDVFLSHSTQDKPAVEWIAGRLRDAGVEPFLDKWHLVPGEMWQPALEKALAASKAVAIFIGPSGIDPWHNEEMRTALSTAVRSRDEYRVIPVLLPRADEKAITGFLLQRTWVDFRSGLDKEEPFQRLVTGVKGIARASESFTLPDEPAPYRGLFKFELEHADRFFGREHEIDTVLQKLERSNFVAVVGASGAGKSSLVLAGVLPRLEQLRSWATPIATFVVTPGADPLRALANRAVAMLPLADRLDWADELVDRMLRRADGLRTALETWTVPDQGTITLVIDQLEELFTHAASESGLAKVEAFAANVRDLVEGSSGRVRVLATVRADFFERCVRLEPLRALLQDRNVLLGPMTTAGLRDAIVQPAATVGAYFETGVAGALMKELEQRPFVLPLLEHALETLWRERKGVWLTTAALDSMGGVAGALKKHADDCWERLPEADRAIGRDVLLRLVSLGDGVPDTRRRVGVDELYAIGTCPEQVDRVLQVLSGPEARLLVLDRGADGRVTEVEVAHEILIQEWPTFRRWVDGARRKLRIHRRVTEAAREWADNGRAHGYLLAGARLLEAEESLGPRWEVLNQLEADLLNASIDAREHEVRSMLEAQHARARALQRSLLAVGLAVLAIFAAGIAIAARAQAERERRLARSRELAGTALRQLNHDPQVALLLIQEAYRSAPTDFVDEAMNRYRSQPGRVTFQGHSDAVMSAAFNPDGRQVVTAGKDGTVRIWDTATSLELASLRGHEGGVLWAAFSPDGRQVVTAGKDGTTRLWDAVSHREVARLGKHKDWVVRATFSPDGRQVVTAERDGTARLWDAATHKEIAQFQGHKGKVWSVAFSPDGRRLVTTGDDGIADLWDVATHHRLSRVEGLSGRMWSAAFSPDGRRIVTAGEDGTARIWDVATSREALARFGGHYGWVWSAAFSPDGRRVVTAGRDGTARIWDASSRQELFRLEGHAAFVRSAFFGPDGLRVVTASDDGTARLWDVGTPAMLRGHPEVVHGAAFSPDGLRVITTGDDDTPLVWDAITHQEIGRLKGHSGVVNNGLFSPDGQRLVTSGNDGTARLWDAGTYRELARLQGHVGWVASVAFSPDGHQVLTAGQDGTARIWDPATHLEVARFQGHTGEIWSAAFSPHGHQIVTAGQDGTARLWDVATRQELARLEGHSGPVLDATFRPDGRRVVTSGKDGTARIWDVATRQELAKLEGHSGWVGGASYSPDGLRVVTAGQDGTARIWDAASYQELAQFRAHAGWVLKAAFSPHGRQVITANQDGIARIWPSWMSEFVGERILALDAGRSFSCEERRRLLHEDCLVLHSDAP